jgi:putative oxidoreductase
MSETPRLVVPALGRIYRALTPFTEPMIRAVAGASLAFHGYPILFGNTVGATQFLGSVGFHPPLFWAYVVGVVEFVCGVCLAIGLFTRVVAVPIIVFLVVAMVSYHWQFGFRWENRGIEYPLFWAIVVFHFLVRGGGACSLDAKLGREI